MLPLEKYSRREEAMDVVSSTKVTHISYRNHEASSEKLWFAWSLDRNLLQIGQKKLAQHVGAISWHHANFHEF